MSENDFWEPSEEFLALVQPGKKVRKLSRVKAVPDKLMHIRTIVDDNYVVFRCWSKRKKSWQYDIESLHFLFLLWEDGALIEVKH